MVIFLKLQQEGTKMNEGQATKDTKYNLRPEIVIIAGSARLPENITAKYVFVFL